MKAGGGGMGARCGGERGGGEGGRSRRGEKKKKIFKERKVQSVKKRGGVKGQLKLIKEGVASHADT